MNQSEFPQLIVLAGVIVFLNVVITEALVHIEVRKRNMRLISNSIESRTSTAISSKSMIRMGMPRRFLEVFLSILSIFLSKPIVTTQLGVALCFGLSCYYGLEFIIMNKTSELPKGVVFKLYDTLFILGPAACYATIVLHRIFSST